MKKILTFMKGVGSLFWIIFFELIPFLVLFYVCWGYVSSFFKETPTGEQYKLLFAGVGFTATLASISFSASNNADSLEEKKCFRQAAHNFLHAVTQFILATMLSYAYFNLGKKIFGDLVVVFQWIIVFVGTVLFYTGVVEAVRGFRFLIDKYSVVPETEDNLRNWAAVIFVVVVLVGAGLSYFL